MRHLPPPANVHYSHTSLKTTLTNSEHNQNLYKLAFHSRCFHQRDLWEEVLVLERLFYKNKSQHQHSGYFRRVVEVRRILKRLKELDLCQLLVNLLNCFYGQESKKAKEHLEYIPSREMIFYSLNRLAGGAMLMNKALKSYVHTFIDFHMLLSRMEFMNFSMVMISLIGRLHELTRAWLSEVKECYFLLINWADCFPISSNDPKELSHGFGLPDTLDFLLSEENTTIHHVSQANKLTFETIVPETETRSTTKTLLKAEVKQGTDQANESSIVPLYLQDLTLIEPIVDIKETQKKKFL
ncbi:hypothetical protein G9A89_008376 [Geosiphon pyriformis]|nr:hypothetical protein G9A89_008376 [Geosiphon pyriformis]